MNRHFLTFTMRQAIPLARGCYSKLRLRCALLGFAFCSTAVLVFTDPIPLALTFAAAAGLPLGVAVIVPALGMLTLELLESGFGLDVARRARQWAHDAAANAFDLAAIQRKSTAEFLHAFRPYSSIQHRGDQ